MRFRTKLVGTSLLAAFAVMSSCPRAHASTVYKYDFQFSQIIGYDRNYPDFEVVVYSPEIIRATMGLQLFVPFQIPLSYSVVYFGENTSGQFVFSKNVPSIGSSYVLFDKSSFAFSALRPSLDYTNLGTYTGMLTGNDEYSIDGSAMLTISEADGFAPTIPPASPTPEPRSLALLGTGLLAAVAMARGRLRRSCLRSS